MAAGGLLGALAASSCCILAVVLFALGVSGAWIGNFTHLRPINLLPRRDAGVSRDRVLARPPHLETLPVPMGRPAPARSNPAGQDGTGPGDYPGHAAIALDFLAPLLLNS